MAGGDPHHDVASVRWAFPAPVEIRTPLAFLFTSDTDFASFSGLQIFRGVCPVRSNSLTHFARLFMLILMVATKLFAILSGAGRLDPGS